MTPPLPDRLEATRRVFRINVNSGGHHHLVLSPEPGIELWSTDAATGSFTVHISQG